MHSDQEVGHNDNLTTEITTVDTMLKGNKLRNIDSIGKFPCSCGPDGVGSEIAGRIVGPGVSTVIGLVGHPFKNVTLSLTWRGKQDLAQP